MDHSELFNLQDSAAVVTGGGGILGTAMCQGLAGAGVKVAVLDISLGAAQRVADQIAQEGERGNLIYRYITHLFQEDLEIMLVGSDRTGAKPFSSFKLQEAFNTLFQQQKTRRSAVHFCTSLIGVLLEPETIGL